MLKKVKDISGAKNFNNHALVEGARFIPKSSLVGIEKKTVEAYPLFAKITKVEGDEVHYNIVKDGKATAFKNCGSSFEKMFFFIDVEPSLDTVLDRIKRNTLNPLHYSYGAFFSKVKASHYSPLFGGTDEIKEQEKNGMYKLAPHFLTASSRYNKTLVDKKDVKKVQKVIDEAMGSPNFRMELNRGYKGFRVDINEYYDKVLGNDKLSNWWRSFEGEEVYSLDDFHKGNFEKILKKYEDKIGEMTENTFHFKTKYHDIKANVLGRDIEVTLVKG